MLNDFNLGQVDNKSLILKSCTLKKNFKVFKTLK